MTSSRVIRGTKAKIFFYVCAILVITGLIACYNNSLSQLEEVRKFNDICHQRQENLSTQLQVISDYKQKLEKVIKNEVAKHQQNVASLETKLSEEKSKSEKVSSDALLKYNSLQQHYNLLKTEHEDFKEESSKSQKEQLDEVNSLQSKLKELKEELRKVQESREQVKTRLLELQHENHQLRLSVDKKASNHEAQETATYFSNLFHDMEDKYNALASKCNVNAEATSPKSKNVSEKGSLNPPAFKGAEQPSSSTKSGPKASSPFEKLNGAKPLILPNVTAESAKKEVNFKPPQGVPAVPDNREDQNEQPEIQQAPKIDKDVQEQENAAKEVLDRSLNEGPNDFGIVEPGQNLDARRNGDDHVKKSDDKKQDDIDYKDMQHEEEDDDDVYGNIGAAADPVVRQ